MKHLRTCLTAAACVIIFMFTIEAIARFEDWYRYSAPPLETYTSDRLRFTDNNGLKRNRPDARYEKWINNNFGFRGANTTLNTPQGKLRIMCVGASETYGLYERPGNEWPQVLSSLLPSSYEVMNTAVAGQWLRPLQRYITEYLAAFSPDYMVLLVSPLPYSKVAAQKKFSSKKQPAKPKKTVHAATQPSLLARIQFRSLTKLKNVLKPLLPQIVVEWKRKQRLENIKARVLRGRQPLDNFPEEFVATYKAELLSFVRQIQQQGITPILTTHPTLLSAPDLTPYRAILLDGQQFNVYYSVKGTVDVASKGNQVARDVAAQLGIPLVDLEQHVGGQKENFMDTVHFSDLGASRVAEAVHAKLITLLPPRP